MDVVVKRAVTVVVVVVVAVAVTVAVAVAVPVPGSRRPTADLSGGTNAATWLDRGGELPNRAQRKETAASVFEDHAILCDCYIQGMGEFYKLVKYIGAEVKEHGKGKGNGKGKGMTKKAKEVVDGGKGTQRQ